MKLNAILFFSILTLFTSCSGQNSTRIADTVLTAGKLTPAVGDTVKEPGNHLMHVMQDSRNNYWFGSHGEGVYRYDGKTIIRFTTKHGLCHDRIDQIREDQSGNMYFNTPVGISKFDGQRFTTLHVTGHEWKLEPGDLWFRGLKDSGTVFRYDGKSLHGLEFPKNKREKEFYSKYPNAVYNPYDIYSIYKDGRGAIWFGTANFGVCRYDGKSFTWISEDDVTEFTDGPSNGVRSTVEDASGKFWFSNTQYRYTIAAGDSGVTYAKEKGIGRFYNQREGSPDGDDYLAAVKDNNGALWIVTYMNGVWCYDGKKLTHYPVKDGDKTITIFSIYKDHQGVLWLGTHESGVYKFNGKTFERFKP